MLDAGLQWMSGGARVLATGASTATDRAWAACLVFVPPVKRVASKVFSRDLVVCTLYDISLRVHCITPSYFSSVVPGKRGISCQPSSACANVPPPLNLAGTTLHHKHGLPHFSPYYLLSPTAPSLPHYLLFDPRGCTRPSLPVPNAHLARSRHHTPFRRDVRRNVFGARRPHQEPRTPP
jgi:hypothetical protein